VEEVVGRAMRGGALMYELKKAGFSRKEETAWETLDLIKSNPRLYPPYVMKLVRACAARWAVRITCNEPWLFVGFVSLWMRAIVHLMKCYLVELFVYLFDEKTRDAPMLRLNGSGLSYRVPASCFTRLLFW
jgi:hypothetical protein